MRRFQARLRLFSRQGRFGSLEFRGLVVTIIGRGEVSPKTKARSDKASGRRIARSSGMGGPFQAPGVAGLSARFRRGLRRSRQHQRVPEHGCTFRAIRSLPSPRYLPAIAAIGAAGHSGDDRGRAAAARYNRAVVERGDAAGVSPGRAGAARSCRRVALAAGGRPQKLAKRRDSPPHGGGPGRKNAPNPRLLTFWAVDWRSSIRLGRETQTT
jgi:hypothetical protein